MAFANTLRLLVLFGATGALAQENAFMCNENGAVVTLSNGNIYYLGKDCDAVRKDGGTGKWWLTASAFAVDTDGQAILLPIEIDCPSLPACWYDS
ncbi:MAG: hypothetical protein AAF754_12865 [Pseudomonadota bacterium]